MSPRRSALILAGLLLVTVAGAVALLAHRSGTAGTVMGPEVLSAKADMGGFAGTKWGMGQDEVAAMFPDALVRGPALTMEMALGEKFPASVYFWFRDQKLSSVSADLTARYDAGCEPDITGLVETLSQKYGRPERREASMALWRTKTTRVMAVCTKGPDRHGLHVVYEPERER